MQVCGTIENRSVGAVNDVAITLVMSPIKKLSRSDIHDIPPRAVTPDSADRGFEGFGHYGE